MIFFCHCGKRLTLLNIIKYNLMFPNYGLHLCGYADRNITIVAPFQKKVSSHGFFEVENPLATLPFVKLDIADYVQQSKQLINKLLHLKVFS